jgi:hypothetical protein
VTLDEVEIVGEYLVDVSLFEEFDQLHGIGTADNSRAGLLVDHVQQLADVVGNSASAFESTN